MRKCVIAIGCKNSCILHRYVNVMLTVMTLSFRTDRSGQTVQTQIRLLLEEQSDQQSDQGLHCLLFHLHHFDKIPLRFGLFV